MIKRYEKNPLLSAADLSYPSTLVFNAGVTKYRGKYVMIFRNDVGFSPANGGKNYSNLGIAFSRDGRKWHPSPRPWLEITGCHPEITRIYDPRLTVIEGRCYICFAISTRAGVCGGIGVIAEDFSSLEVLSISTPDNRNMVLFPEKINGRFVRLERPFPEYSIGFKEHFDIWISSSENGRDWGDSRLLLSHHDVPFCNSKIGPGAPPIRTEKGYLTTFHAVWKDAAKNLDCWEYVPGATWNKIYYGGIMLLDLHDPTRVIGLCKTPLLTPRANYEVKGFRGSVIFPGGMILEDNGEVKIYYGAADTVECLASAHVDELLAMCEPFTPDHFNLNNTQMPCYSPLITARLDLVENSI